MLNMEFYKGRRVLVTGHTGFKGTWLCQMLVSAGALVTGYALNPPAKPSIFALSGMADRMNSVIGDIRNLERLKDVFGTWQPELVFHLAAQPIVRDSYKDPVYTYGTNVMGTVHILECVRQNSCVKSFLNVTTDKVYKNQEWEWGYRENEMLDGFDPYSNSKSCSELVTHSYRNSFFQDGKPPVSTARAGNVIGGGDFASDRIIPDCVRAAMRGETITVRNPYSVRPYQHVLEPLAVYLMIVQKQYEEADYAGYYNVGPGDNDCITTGQLADLFCKSWGNGQIWENRFAGGPHEAAFLKPDCSKLRSVFGWQPRYTVAEAVQKTVDWFKQYEAGKDTADCMNRQIRDFLSK